MSTFHTKSLYGKWTWMLQLVDNVMMLTVRRAFDFVSSSQFSPFFKRIFVIHLFASHITNITLSALTGVKFEQPGWILILIKRTIIQNYITVVTDSDQLIRSR